MPRPIRRRKPTRDTNRTHALTAIAISVVVAFPAFSDCDADLDRDGVIGGGDLGILLSAFGEAGPRGVGDLNGDGIIDGADLGILLGSWGDACALPPIEAELAGEPLLDSPFFQHSLAFNVGDSVSVQVDPALYPRAIGVPTTIYVVAHRSATEWAGDATLVDVRAGGAQAVTFPGGALAANQVVVAAGGLSGDAGTGVGVGYDVVIDLDGSGTLSGGDLIDATLDPADIDRPGFSVVKDLTTAGPFPVSTANYTVTGVTSGFSSERVYYPTQVASMGLLPLVVISHGNGHQYTWYDWLGSHLASHGCIVMSHQNNTQPGIETASTTTLQHTQAMIAQQGTIVGGALNGHIDANTIVWIGHSRGGEGVTRAYDRIFDGTFTPTNYALADIKLVSAIAPTDFLGTNSANPHMVPYHLIYGAADGDVCGCPNNDVADSFNLYERAASVRWATYVHGADHNDFNCCGVNDFSGPAGTAIGNSEAQRVGKVAYLCLVKAVLDGSVAAADVLARHYEDLRPLSIAAGTIVVNDHRPASAAPAFVIDDFQTNTGIALSSSGGAVTATVTNLAEAKSNDANTSFSWLASDVMNGMVRGRTSDLERAAVFDYAAPAFLEFEVPAAGQDTTAWRWLSFRAGQGTRHPNTTAALGNQTFLVTLRDIHGTSRSVNLASYKIGLQEPYQRTGFGTGAGWQDEVELVRIRLGDFLAGDNTLDLSAIVAVRFDFAAPDTSAQGRIVLDDVRFDAH